MRKLFIVLFLAGIVQSSLAQQHVLKGKISDTLEKKNLQNAVVSLLGKSDSTLYKFTRTDKNGSFLINNVKPGQYMLLVTYPKFADLADIIEVKDQPETDLGSIPLTLKASLLEAVIIRSAGAVRIKGDTTEFVADSFKVKEGATVEDLLKKLPGFQVNSKGEVTTQGQKVDKVLVDGEEFFGDDPTMATQNISAKAVDKVQVFDTKTDQQNLTGISSGNEGKTVNIKLKENSKKGSFGKAHFGTDFQNLIDAKVLANKFVGSKKVSVYGTKSDISTGSLNWDDRQKLGMDNDYEYDELSGFYYGFGSNDEFENWGLRGLPNSYTAGGLFANKWRDAKDNVNLSYRYNRLATVNHASTLTQNILANSISYRNKFQDTRGLNQQHSGTAKYEWKIDSLASIKLTSIGTYKMNDLFSDLNSEFLDSSYAFINRGAQLITTNTTKLQTDNQLVYKQLFKKKNRQFIATIRYGTIKDDKDYIIQSHTDFYVNGVVDSVDKADQKKLVDGNSKTLGAKLTWSEPITLKWNLVMEYAANQNNAYSHRNTYDKDISGKYAVYNKDFSNNFDMDAFSNSGTAIIRFTDKKLRGAFGMGISSVILKLLDIDSNYRTRYHFLNLTPQGSFSYMYKPQSRIWINYRGTTTQPTIDQLQPIRDNTDRLNVFVGNPNLKVGFNHNISLGFNTYKVLTQTGIFSNISYNIPINSISFSNYLDVSRGKQVYTPINVNGNRRWNGWIGLWKDGGEKKVGIDVNINASGGRNVNFNNQKKNTTKYMNSDFHFGLSYGQEDKKRIQVGPTVGYNISESTLNPQYNANYWNYGGTAEGMILLPWKLELRSDVNFDLRQHLPAFPANPNQINWNASLVRKVFKDKSGKIYLMVNDILDQNKGFNRSINSNYITEDRYSKISRYFLLKFEWSFNKMPGQAPINK